MRFARFTSALLLGCFCLLMLSFSVSASDDQQGYLFLDLSTSGSIQNGSMLHFDNNSYDISTVTIFPMDRAYNDLYFSFDIVCPGYSLGLKDSSGNTIALPVNQPVLFQNNYMQFGISRYRYNDNGNYQIGFHVIAHLTISNSNYNPQTLAVNHKIFVISSAPISGAQVINFTCTSDRYEILRLINSRINTFQAHFDSWVSDANSGWAFAANNIDLTRTYIFDLRKKFTQDSFDYQSISYDNHGDVTIEDQAAPWYIALLNSFKSIVAPLAEQAEQEQKAKDAGALDAMDQGYDRSDFSTIAGIFHFADFGDYDDDVAADAAGDGPSTWFSNYNKYQLDEVDQRRYQNDGYIDFYEQNIEEILDILSGNRARRRDSDE